MKTKDEILPVFVGMMTDALGSGPKLEKEKLRDYSEALRWVVGLKAPQEVASYLALNSTLGIEAVVREYDRDLAENRVKLRTEDEIRARHYFCLGMFYGFGMSADSKKKEVLEPMMAAYCAAFGWILGSEPFKPPKWE